MGGKVGVISGDNEKVRGMGPRSSTPDDSNVFSLLIVIQRLTFLTTYVLGAEPIILYSDLLIAADCADTLFL